MIVVKLWIERDAKTRGLFSDLHFDKFSQTTSLCPGIWDHTAEGSGGV
jgi:hypothetical protein